VNYAVYEAMACGVPIVISRNTPLSSELEASGGVLLIEENANALSIAIETLLNNASLQANMGNAAKAWVASQFEGETRTNNYVRMYREIMNQ
jgi:glycosyltransferase involved in cell wall biosynthesis